MPIFFSKVLEKDGTPGKRIPRSSSSTNNILVAVDA
jgi:hypothetical protein